MRSAAPGLGPVLTLAALLAGAGPGAASGSPAEGEGAAIPAPTIAPPRPAAQGVCPSRSCAEPRAPRQRPAGPAPGRLAVTDDTGAVLATVPLAEDGRWCLSWAHSVTGGAVADCFRVTGPEMVLERSYLHDFAAGLGHLPDRGTLHGAEGGGYWVEGIDALLPKATLRLRVGRAAVGHALASGPHRLDLSGLAPGRRVLIRPAPGAGGMAGQD